MTSDSDTRGTLWASLRRRTWIVLFCPLVAGITAFGLSAAETKEYSASAHLSFADPGRDQRVFVTAVFFRTIDPNRAAANYVERTSLKPVAERTADRIDPKLTAADILSRVSVGSPGYVVSITATDPDPELAAQLANTFAQTFIEFRRHADRKTIDLYPASPPSSPSSSPNIALNTAAGVMLGLILGIGLARLGERFDERRRSSDDLGNASPAGPASPRPAWPVRHPGRAR